MMVNNGNYRNTAFVLRRMINGLEKLDGGFPIVESILNPFAQISSVTLDEFNLLTDEEYLNRLNLFYEYLEFNYLFFRRIDFPNLSSFGTDNVLCPIGSSVDGLLYIEFELNLFEDGLIKEGELYLVVKNNLGEEVAMGENAEITILYKEAGVGGFVDWNTIAGTVRDIQFGENDSRVLVTPYFRIYGPDHEDLDMKNIYGKIISVEFSFMAIGEKNIVFTDSNQPFFIINFVSNLDSSYQDLPLIEPLEIAINTGENFVDPTEIVFMFQSNIKQRPVLIYPAIFPDLSEIYYIEEEMDILDAGTFIKSEMIMNFQGSSMLFKVYSAKNMVIYPRQLHYKFII
jgi:hypothetical protein